ncbi:MAG: HTH domain-containing protein, partial [Bacillota bacterium]
MDKPGDANSPVSRGSTTQAGVLGRLLYNGFVSGQELSRHLGISRTAIWKQIEHLRGLGYTIEAVPRQGY